jgi:hypothetical protein
MIVHGFCSSARQAFARDFCPDNRQSRRHDQPGVLRHRPFPALGFAATQILGPLLARSLVRVLYPDSVRVANEVIVPDHHRKTTIDQWSSS